MGALALVGEGEGRIRRQWSTEARGKAAIGFALHDTTDKRLFHYEPVAANYLPSHDSLYLASTSPDVSHTVIETYGQFWWVAILLIVIILILIVWWYLRTR